MSGPGRRLVVLGAGGLLGRHVVEALGRSPAARVAGFDRAACDITEAAAVERALDGADAVVQCAAFTAVDAAEAQPEEAMRVNGLGSERVARAASKRGARLIHVSTDFVFDGLTDEPYPVDAVPRPLSAYGRSKAEGEARARAVGGDLVLVRVQALYGRGGTGFSSRLPALVRSGAHLRLDGERRVQPTPASLAARLLVALLDAPAGTYHVSTAGETTWAGFASALAAAYGVELHATVLDARSLGAPAARPAYCLFSHAALRAAGLPSPPPWDQALAAALPELEPH